MDQWSMFGSERSFTEPSGQSFLWERYDTAIFCFPKVYPSHPLFPVFPLFLLFPQKRPRIGQRFRCAGQYVYSMFGADIIVRQILIDAM